MKALRRLDVFPKFDAKFEQDARDKTVSGAILSVAALLLIVVLVVGEINYFLSIEDRHELYVDTDSKVDDPDNKLRIQLNVSFPSIPCDLISLDAIDSFGEFQKDIEKNTVKHRIDADLRLIEQVEELVDMKKEATVPKNEDGTVKEDCQSCYGAETHPGQCCNTCDQVREAYQRRGWSFHLNDVSIAQCATERLRRAHQVSSKEGCNLYASLRVERVTGNIHFVPGRSFVHLGHHLHDLADIDKLNVSHVIHLLQFGDAYRGLVNPLDGKAQRVDADAGSGKFTYFVKVVPTRYERLSAAKPLETNQYSVTEHFSNKQHDDSYVPGVFIIYDLSPIKVRIYESRPYPSLAHFLLQLCAISGGVFTVMGLVDALLYHGSIRIKRKMQMGKQG